MIPTTRSKSSPEKPLAENICLISSRSPSGTSAICLRSMASTRSIRRLRLGTDIITAAMAKPSARKIGKTEDKETAAEDLRRRPRHDGEGRDRAIDPAVNPIAQIVAARPVREAIDVIASAEWAVLPERTAMCFPVALSGLLETAEFVGRRLLPYNNSQSLPVDTDQYKLPPQPVLH